VPFSFPEIFRPFSGTLPTIGKNFNGNSTDSTISGTQCPHAPLGEHTTPSPVLSSLVPLNVSANGGLPKQSKKFHIRITIQLSLHRISNMISGIA
jgi:hypothetical protein